MPVVEGGSRPAVTVELPDSRRGEPDDAGRIAFRLRIGVTGHRTLANPDRVRSAVAERLPQIVALYQASDATPVRVVILSALAEGADRVVVRAAIDALGPDAVEFEAVLPMMQVDYLETFYGPDAGREFHELARAARAYGC